MRTSFTAASSLARWQTSAIREARSDGSSTPRIARAGGVRNMRTRASPPSSTTSASMRHSARISAAPLAASASTSAIKARASGGSGLGAGGGGGGAATGARAGAAAAATGEGRASAGVAGEPSGGAWTRKMVWHWLQRIRAPWGPIFSRASR